MWAVVFSTGQATVTIRCSSSTNTTTVGAGITKLMTPLSPGQMTVTMVRNSQTIINYKPTDYTYVTNPATCEFYLRSSKREMRLTRDADNYNA